LFLIFVNFAIKSLVTMEEAEMRLGPWQGQSGLSLKINALWPIDFAAYDGGHCFFDKTFDPRI